MNIVSFSEQSPFDSIRRFDEQGNEYWLARELMIVMGYSKWDAFLSAIERAIDNMELAGDNVKNNASDYKEPSGKTNQERLNYQLSRYGAYMVALACDGRKVEVALAKKYFAIKTREAEVQIPKYSEQIELAKLEIQRLTLINESLKIQTNYFDRREAIATLQGVKFLALLDNRPDAVVEVREVVTETVVCRGNSNVSFAGKSTAQVAKEYGFNTGKDFELWLKQNKAEHLICQGMRAVQAPYIPEENLVEVKKLFANKRQNTTRQLSIGE